MPKNRQVTRKTPPGAAGVFVDSGAWIALFSASDGQHRAADAMFRAVRKRGIDLLTTNLVVAEVQRLLLFRAGIRPALRALELIDSSNGVRVEFATAGHHLRALDWLYRLGDQRITYTDAVSFAVMEAMRCRAAMSFDHDFVVAGFELWPVDAGR